MRHPIILLSVLCALAPSVEVLVAARFAQGLTGGVGVVIASAAGRDLYSGGQLLRYYGRLTVLGGLAAIVGPVLGGQLAAVTDWRGIFLFLSGVGTLLLVASLLFARETLPAGLLGLLTLIIVPVQLLLIAFAMRAFSQQWNVEIEMTEDEYRERFGDDSGRGPGYGRPQLQG